MKRGKFFASTTSFEDLTLPAHDEALAGDTLYSIRLNYQWRKLIAAALQDYFSHGFEGLALDNEDLLNNLINDLYNAETFGMLTTRLQNVDMGANQTITTTTYQPVLGSGFSHTATKPNMRVRCENIRLVQGAAGVEVSVRVDVETLTADDFSEFITSGTDPREGAAVATYSDVEPGEIYIVRLLGKRPSNTGTVNRYPVLSWIVEEWD